MLWDAARERLNRAIQLLDREMLAKKAGADIDEDYEAYRADQPVDASPEQVARSTNRKARP